MKWRLTNPSKVKQLKRAFDNRGIDASEVAFYDSASFLRHEAQDPRILNAYAEYVEAQEYSEEYLLSAQKRVEVVAHAVGAAIKLDGRQGACVDASKMIGRMLDRLGIWNYVAKATLSIEFPHGSGIEPIYFPEMDPTRTFEAAHAIVVAPPFGIIDVTLRQQPYPGRITDYLPDQVVSNLFEHCQWKPKDVMSVEALEIASQYCSDPSDFYRRECPDKIKVIERLRPRGVDVNGTKLKYVIVAVGGAQEQLEDVLGYTPSGRTAFEIFNEDVLPALG